MERFVTVPVYFSDLNEDTKQDVATSIVFRITGDTELNYERIDAVRDFLETDCSRGAFVGMLKVELDDVDYDNFSKIVSSIK